MEDFREETDRRAASQLPVFSRTDDSGANQHISIARLLSVFETNPLDRFWPVWLVLLSASAAYTGWSVAEYSPVSFMLGLHLIIAFGLLSWNDQLRATVLDAWRRLRR